MIRIGICILVLLVIAPQAEGNLILNGDFENNNTTVTRFNMSNTAFTSSVADVTAFGTSEELDLVTGLSFGIAPQNGNWKAGLHQHWTLETNVDAFSFNLSSPVISGNIYTLQFFAVGSSEDPLGPVEIGLSSNKMNFGVQIFSATPAGTTAWSQFDYTFTAPVNASFLTVRNAVVHDMYVFVDNFSLVPEPVSAMLMLLGAAWMGAGRKR